MPRGTSGTRAERSSIIFDTDGAATGWERVHGATGVYYYNPTTGEVRRTRTQRASSSSHMRTSEATESEATPSGCVHGARLSVSLPENSSK